MQSEVRKLEEGLFAELESQVAKGSDTRSLIASVPVVGARWPPNIL